VRQGAESCSTAAPPRRESGETSAVSTSPCESTDRHSAGLPVRSQTAVTPLLFISATVLSYVTLTGNPVASTPSARSPSRAASASFFVAVPKEL